MAWIKWHLASLFMVAASCLASAVPSVNIGLSAAFPASPYLLELLETAAGENETCYFDLLDNVADGYFDTASTDQTLYESFVGALRSNGCITRGDALSTFRLALSLRSAAPRIEAHYQYYDNSVHPRVSSECGDTFVTYGHLRCCHHDIFAGGSDCFPDDISVKLLDLDRSIGSTHHHDREVVLYTDVTSSEFRQFHKVLVSEARRNKISYRVRYKRPMNFDALPLSIGGFGVELALKRTDYIVIDDRDSQSHADQPSEKLADLDSDQDLADLRPLSTSELSTLGLKAASFIMQSDDPFDTLLKLSQDFPRYSSSIALQDVDQDFLLEHKSNRKILIPPGMNVLWMNGVQLNARQIEPLDMIDMLRRERNLIDGIQSLGLSSLEAISLLSHQQLTLAKSDSGSMRFDWRDNTEEGRVIVWLNDIETDPQYAEFSPNIRVLLTRMYPGQIPPLRRNMFHLVVPLDFARVEDISVLFELLNLAQRKVPIRMGFTLALSNDFSVYQAKVVYYILDNYGLPVLCSYLNLFAKQNIQDQINVALIDRILSESEVLPDAKPLAIASVLKSEDYGEQLHQARQWTARLDVNCSLPTMFFNGAAIPRTDDWLQSIGLQMQSDLQMMQQALLAGELSGETWLPSLFLANASLRRNTYIYPHDPNALVILDVRQMLLEHADLFGQLPVVEANPESSKENWAVLTVVVCLDTLPGREILLSALQFRRDNPGIYLEVMHNPLRSHSDADNVLIANLKASEDQMAKATSVEALDEILTHSKPEMQESHSADYSSSLARFLNTTSLPFGRNLLILNGRVLGPILDGDTFSEEDFSDFLEFERKARILPVFGAMDNLGMFGKLAGPLMSAKLTSIVAISTISENHEAIFESASTLRTSAFDELAFKYTSIDIGDSAQSSIHLVCALNPASELAQRWAPIVKVMSQLEGVYVRIFLNPLDWLEELPVKRFYRYVLEAEPRFDDAGKLQPSGASFKGLPSEALLTAGMDVPPAWLVVPKVSVHDLDNIKLSSARTDVVVMYELQHILIEGHSRDEQGSPPRGAQLVLGTEKIPHLMDTIIMANLGFFQFKANPGYYQIQLQEGRSSEVLEIESIGAHGWDPVPGDDGTDVFLMNFQGTTLYPRMRRRPGMEEADLLAQSPEPSTINEGLGLVTRGIKFAEGLFGSVSHEGNDQKSRQRQQAMAAREEHAEINIFSVASGHLYERMLNIMTVSVMRHTNHTVKFWFIEQFLSPSFKDFIPHLAREYGFRYELVTYKWPHWLRGQTEKQREIWGFKILFLDVLFPLSLDKVIFVDADQIVRTDMIELVRMDLQGAPYGFTPMCDSRTEMEGFRFWKQGYWANFLRGLPYHISALYVVDLKRFRQLAAGDRLRQQYHSLSADPASLANLDQDLPNNMQFTIPIFSLPQDWLWCETWCADTALATAKTIDLCNNPLTKEPKLDRARRQVPEWTVYDDEIAALDRRRRRPTDASEAQPNPKSRRLDTDEEREPKTEIKDEL